MTTSKEYVTLSISDVHLGHPKTPTDFIINNVWKYILTEENISKADRVVIVGDLFDRLLDFPADVITPIQLFMAMLIRKCEKYNTQLRVLEGTPGHDREQNKHFINIKEMLDSSVDLMYVRDVFIEHDIKSDKYFLYIPDEFRPTAAETYTVVLERLAELNIKQVDYAYIHGFTDLQVPKMVDAHNYETYSKIVKHAMFVGHDHHPRNYEKLFVQGSTDRLRQGEEEDKGAWLVVEKDNKLSSTFLINKGAAKYLTFHCKDMSEDNYLSIIETRLLDRPKITYCRLVISDEDIHNVWYKTLRKLYPDVSWAKESVEVDAIEYIPDTPTEHVAINANTVPELIKAKLITMGKDNDYINACIEYISRCV